MWGLFCWLVQKLSLRLTFEQNCVKTKKQCENNMTVKQTKTPYCPEKSKENDQTSLS